MTANIEIRNVSKQFGAMTVLDDLSLSIKAREFIVFLGPSGCGKSTLLRMIAGLETVDGGDIAINGERIDHLPPGKRGIAMVFQSYALYPHMTVRENMGFALRFAGVAKEQIARQVNDAARILALEPLLDRYPKQLSGGQRQRVAIGRAIVRNPQVFLFDEPLSNLDAELRVHMRIEIARLHKELQTTIIYVTHDQVEAMTLADTIVVLRDGVIEQVGSPLELYDEPANQFVAGFIGSPKMNFLAATIVEKTADSTTIALKNHGGARLTRPVAGGAVGDAVSLGVRAEHFGLAGAGNVDIALDVDVAEHLGSTSYVYANASGESLVIEREESRHENGNERITVSISAARAYLFDSTGKRLR